MTKRPFGHGDLRNMSNFKANAADYAYYLTLSDEGRLYCLSDRQVYALMVQLDYIGWLTRWYNVEDITQTTVQYIRADIEEALMSCVDVQILVDQANENLITTVTNRAIQSQMLRDVLEDRYDGTPGSINADAPTTTWSYSGTDDGNEALCASLMAFVYQFARAQADSVRAGQIGGLAAIGLIAALLIPGLNVFFLAGAAIAVLLGLGTVGVTTETAIAALTDTAALDEVVCYMRDQLQGAAVSESSWSSCLDSYPFGVGSHAAIVADFLKATLASNYLTFLNIIGTGFNAVTTNQSVPACPCDPPPDPECIDLTDSPGNWVFSPGPEFGEWISGQGWAGGLPGHTIFNLEHFIVVGGGLIGRLKIRFNESINGIILYSGGTSWTQTVATDEIDIDESDYPELFPWNVETTVLGMTRAGNSVPSSLRVVETCLYPAD